MKHGLLPPDAQIIELIDDDAASASGGQRSNGQPDDAGGRRWVGAAAIAALVACISYGVIGSAISAHAPTSRAAGPTTTTARPSTTPALRTDQLVAPQFYVAGTVPDGFTMHFAETLGIGGNPADFVDAGTAELWATAGATATSGSWFVVSAGTHHATGHNAYRTTVAGELGTVEHDPVSGEARVSFDKEGEGLEIVAFGWSDRQLLRLADSVFFIDGQFRFTDTFFATDHTLQMHADPSTAVYGLPVAWVGYTTAVPAAWAENFTITVSGDPGSDWDTARRFALLPSTSVSLGRVSAIGARLATDPDTTVIQWRDGARLITLRGNIDLDQLRWIAASVHPADSSDVRAQVKPDQPFALPSSPQAVVGSGPPDEPWTASVATFNDASVWTLGTIDGPATAYRVPGVQPSIETFVDEHRTYVMARAPRAPTPLVLNVNLTGSPTIAVPLVDVDPTSPDVFGAYAFTDATTYAAQIVDGTGAELAHWPA